MILYLIKRGNLGSGLSNLTNNPPNTDPLPENYFSLSVPSRVSAGVYNSSGVLMRTLLSGVQKEAGIYEVKWDGTNDYIQSLPVDNYTIKIITNNVNYQWQGVIGNSSRDVYSDEYTKTVFKSLYPPNDIVIVGNKASYTVDFNEGQTSNSQFDITVPQVRITPYNFSTSNQATNFLCTDGTNYYFASHDSYDTNKASFVYGTSITTNNLVTFSNGVSHTVNSGPTYASVIGLRNTKAIISGIAASSSFVFIARESVNELLVLDKTGLLVETLSYTSPRALYADGSDLWMVTGTNSLQKYAVNTNGTLSTGVLSISGLSLPLNVKVTGTTLAVVDGGTSQQIKTFNKTTGAAIWTLGVLGGIYNSPQVTQDKFAFPKALVADNVDGRGSVAFAADGSFWVVDPLNRRIQNFNSSRVYVQSITWQDATRTCSVDPNNPANVAANLLQWEVDYTSPIKQSYVLKYNWAGSSLDLQAYIKNLTTFTNGKMYFLMTHRTGEFNELVELDPTFGARSTGMGITGYFAKLYPNGDIYNLNGTALGQQQEIVRVRLLNPGAANPSYSAVETVVTIPGGDINTARLSGPRVLPYERTSTNILVNFRGGADSNEDGNPHLSGIDLNTGVRKWQTAFSTFVNYNGDFPSDGSFDVGNLIAASNGYYGSVALAIERNIIYGYNGEFWKNGETNKWNHYYDNGLFVGQFGVAGYEYSPEHPEMAGNAYDPSIVKVGNDYFMYHNDESVHGGLSRWKISGLNSITEQSIPITTSFVRKSEKPILAGTDLMAGLPYRAPDLINGTAGWTRNPTANQFGWEVKTNDISYGVRNPVDLYIRSAVNGDTKTVTRDLGANSGLTSWVLSGKVLIAQGTIINHGLINTLVIKDSADKIIAKFEMYIPNYTNTGFFFKGNDTTIYTNNLSDYGNSLYAVAGKLQNLTIAANTNGITFTYANYAPITVPIYDGTANKGNPIKMQIICSAGDTLLGTVGMTLKEMRFVTNNN